eukprot:11303162-Ditylum_brightwellii.AAC.1
MGHSMPVLSGKSDSIPSFGVRVSKGIAGFQQSCCYILITYFHFDGWKFNRTRVHVQLIMYQYTQICTERSTFGNYFELTTFSNFTELLQKLFHVLRTIDYYAT